MGLSATYQVLPGPGAFGGQFTFNFDEDPGKGPSADVSATAFFYPSDGGTRIPVPVALTQGANGNFQYSLDYTTAATPLCSPSCPLFLASGGGGAPQVEVFGDSQSIATQLEGDGTPQFLDAFNTFSVGITSLDPNFQPASIDGRTVNIETATTTPEPSSVLLFASGLVAVFLVSRAHRL